MQGQIQEFIKRGGGDFLRKGGVQPLTRGNLYCKIINNSPQKAKHRRTHTSVKKIKLKVLPQKVIDGIRKFVFFVGNIRWLGSPTLTCSSQMSGHS